MNWQSQVAPKETKASPSPFQKLRSMLHWHAPHSADGESCSGFIDPAKLTKKNFYNHGPELRSKISPPIAPFSPLDQLNALKSPLFKSCLAQDIMSPLEQFSAKNTTFSSNEVLPNSLNSGASLGAPFMDSAFAKRFDTTRLRSIPSSEDSHQPAILALGPMFRCEDSADSSSGISGHANFCIANTHNNSDFSIEETDLNIPRLRPRKTPLKNLDGAGFGGPLAQQTDQKYPNRKKHKISSQSPSPEIKEPQNSNIQKRKRFKLPMSVVPFVEKYQESGGPNETKKGEGFFESYANQIVESFKPLQGPLAHDVELKKLNLVDKKYSPNRYSCSF